MASEPLVSVVMPTFNYARYFAACLNSICQQEYDRLELVIVDDASTDESWDLIGTLTASDPVRSIFGERIITSRNERNLGAHTTLNRGINAARGELIAIINADDMFGPARIPLMVSALAENRGRFAFSAVKFIGEGAADIDSSDFTAQRLRAQQLAIERFPTVGFACLASNVAISTGNFLFEKRLYDEVGPFSALKYCHDWDFLLRALLRTEPVYVKEAAYLYRIHGSNTFRSLGGVAHSETSSVLRSYFRNASLRSWPNRLAPTPGNWPGVYETFMTAYGLWRHSDAHERAV